jgi:hypothetical protein
MIPERAKMGNKGEKLRRAHHPLDISTFDLRRTWHKKHDANPLKILAQNGTNHAS